MNNIQIFTITLKDYRQYKDLIEVDLATNADQNINVIEGQNGAGKSNLLNAITLCFYDKETHLDSKTDQGLEADPYVNLKQLEGLEEGDTATGYIEVTLGRERPQWTFKRTFTTGKLSGGGFDNSTGELELTQRFGEDWRPMEKPNTRLSQILPNHVHKYFLFDGEQLDEFFEEGYTTRVRNAILDVSHIQLLNRAIDHLRVVKKEYEDNAADFEGEADRLQRLYKEAEEELERLQDEQELVEGDISDAQDNLAEVEEKLAGSRDENVQEWLSERKYLNKQLKDEQEDLAEAKTDGGQALATAGIAVYNQDALAFTKARFAEMEENGELPPKIQKWFVDKLLTRNECICGDCLDDEDKRDQLRQLREEVPNIDEENIEGKIEVPHILEGVDEKVEALLDEKRRIEDIQDAIAEHNRKLDEISAKLERADVPEDVDVAYLESRRKEIQGRIEDMRVREGQLDEKINQQQETVDDRYGDWQQELEKEEKHADLLRKIRFIDAAQKRLQEIKTEILEEVRSETRAYLEQYFNELIWKNEHFDVELTEGYQVKLSVGTGEKKLGSLSAGERQVLALSFMSALSQISGFSAPIVIDTPLGRISSKPKKQIAQKIPNYLEGTQVTFLMTDEEYTQEVRVFFKQHVAREYHLDYHDEATEVVDQLEVIEQ